MRRHIVRETQRRAKRVLPEQIAAKQFRVQVRLVWRLSKIRIENQMLAIRPILKIDAEFAIDAQRARAVAIKDQIANSQVGAQFPNQGLERRVDNHIDIQINDMAMAAILELAEPGLAFEHIDDGAQSISLNVAVIMPFEILKPWRR